MTRRVISRRAPTLDRLFEDETLLDTIADEFGVTERQMEQAMLAVESGGRGIKAGQALFERLYDDLEELKAEFEDESPEMADLLEDIIYDLDNWMAHYYNL